VNKMLRVDSGLQESKKNVQKDNENDFNEINKICVR
jgi:hypothetical protein